MIRSRISWSSGHLETLSEKPAVRRVNVPPPPLHCRAPPAPPADGPHSAVVCSVGGKKKDASPEPSLAGETSRPRAVGPLGPLPSFVPEPLRSTPQISAAWDSAHIVIPVGCATGFASGAFGIGGGVVMTAALGTACGMAQVEAVATSLCAIVPTGLA